MKVLFFVQPGANSRSIFLDMMRGFERAGHSVIHWELEPIWSAFTRAGEDQALRSRLASEFTAMARAVLVHNRVDLSISMWTNALATFTAAAVPLPSGGTALASIFDLIPQPHLCYWLDAPHWAHQGEVAKLLDTPVGALARSPMIHNAINNAATATEMTEVFDMKNVIPQHYGINEEVFRPRGGAKEFDIVFGLGPGDPPPTPLMLDQLQSQTPDTQAIRHEAAEQVRTKLVALSKSWPDRAVAPGAVMGLLDALLQSQLKDRHTPMLKRLRGLCELNAGSRRAAEAMWRSALLYISVTTLVRSIEAWERAFTFAYLSRRFKCATFGDGGKAMYAWGVRAVDLGNLSWEQQADAYSRAWLGLNVMRWQDDAGLNLKPYEITASGAACLCARRTGLEELFEPNIELAVFEGAAEARSHAEALLSDKPRLEAMAEAGRQRTLRDYTWTAVARDLVSAVNSQRAKTGA